VPTRDPRLLASRPASSIYFDMAKVFAKGIPPEDWYETGPGEDNWIQKATKYLVHLPVNSLYHPNVNKTLDCSPQSENVAVGSVVTGTDHVATDDMVVSAADHSISMPGPITTKPAASKDSDSDDERISRVLQSCMEPTAVVGIKTEPLEIVTEQGSAIEQCSVDSPTAKTAEGKAQRLMKLKQSGISPDMLRRRLQKIEEKLSALRQSKMSKDVEHTSGSECQSIDSDRRETVSKPQQLSDNSLSDTDAERKHRASDEAGASCLRLHESHAGVSTIVGSNSSLDNFPLNLKVSTTPNQLNETMSSEFPLGSSICSGVSRQQTSGHVDGAACNHLSDQLPWYVGNLSLDTKWDSQFIESAAVRQTLLDAMRNWRLRKPLDLIMSGQLWDVPLDWTAMSSTWKTDRTVDCCWNSVLWYFGALLDEPVDPYSLQQLMTSSLEADAGSKSVEELLSNDCDDWWGIGTDKIDLPVVGPLEEGQKQSIMSTLPLSGRENVQCSESDSHESGPAAVGHNIETAASKVTPVVSSVVLPSVSSTVADGGKKSRSHSGSSHKEKSEHASAEKVPDSSSSHASAKPSSQKHKRKRDDRKKTSHEDKLVATEPVKDSDHKDQDVKKERKKTTSDKDKEKHVKKAKIHKDEVDDTEDKTNQQLESVDSNRTDIADLLRLFVGTDEKKLSLLSKTISNAKQFNSHKLTTSTSLHWAVALALLDEDVFIDDAVIPMSLWSEQNAGGSVSDSGAQTNNNKGVATESSMKRVFDFVSDLMNGILGGKSVADFSDLKSGAANVSPASHTAKPLFSEPDNGPVTSPANAKMPVAGKVKAEMESESVDGNYVGQKVEPASVFAEKSDDVEEMKKMKVRRHDADRQKFVSAGESSYRKVVLSKQASDAEEQKVQTGDEHKKHELGTGGKVVKEHTTDSDMDASTKQQHTKLSSIVGKALTSFRDEHSRLESRKDDHRHRSKKETAGTADKETRTSSTSRQASAKRKHSSSHRSEHEKSKHRKHERKSDSHDHQRKVARTEKRTSRDRPLSSSFEAISDTELEGQSTSVNSDKASRTDKQHMRTSATRTRASDRAKVDDLQAESGCNAASRLDTNTRTVADNHEKSSPSVASEKLPSLPSSTSQPPVTTSSSSGSLAHVTFRSSVLYKIANTATAPPVKTATTDILLASRGPRFMQTFRRSQIAKRRSQRESQETATGGKLLSTSHRSPNSMIVSKPSVRPIGLSLEATLAAFSTSTLTGQSDSSSLQPQTSEPEGSSVAISSSGSTSSLPISVSVLSSSSCLDVRKSPSKLDLTSSLPPLPPYPATAGNDGAPALPDDDQCDSRTTSVAGSPPPDLSLLCGNPVPSGSGQFDQPIPVASLSDASVYPTMQSQGDFGNSYWMGGYMPSYGAYGYESSAYSGVYPWYYGQAWNMMCQSSVTPVSIITPDSVPPSSDALASCDESYGSYPSFPANGSLPTSQHETMSPWPSFSTSQSSFGSEPPFLSPTIPITNRLRAPPRLSSSDDEAVWPQKIPLLPLPVQSTDAIPPLLPPNFLARFSSSGERLAECHADICPQKKRFYVYSNNDQLKADVSVSIQ